MTKVSYVITVYNKAPFLPGVIDALKCQQGDFEREFIFINDGSSDESMQVVKRETAGLENVVLIDQKNQGVAIATNNGVKVARGDVIKLVDSDDILAPFCTELLLKTMKETESDFVFGISGEYETEISFEKPDQPEVIRFEDPLYSVIDRGFARVSHCLFKKSLFKKAGGCDERVFSQDHSLFIRLCTHGTLAQVRHTVCLSPKDEPGRIMNNNAQVIHDATIALAYHLQDHDDLSAKHKKAAQKKIISRVWKWAKKEHKFGFFSSEFLLYLASSCGVSLQGDQLVYLCSIFRKNATVRLP
ncbi:glycosyltransferase [Terasakiella sp. SH-1]|uniref:glycosyltransferase family 2 protein n=1 Tax=Terasakiella sp. SH-1 TaxID=2560057 RepID=UPI00142F7090|nr:glycosyltransferase [Terasakiella sp. SH-1]